MPILETQIVTGKFMHKTVALAQELIRRQSITPDDAGCQALISARLRQIGFNVQQYDFGEVKNCLITHGNGQPSLIFLGHTDVVPPGPLAAWQHDPFAATIQDNVLFGRGAADMKSSVAAFVTALEQFVQENPQHAGLVGLLLTSDEEGHAVNGVKKVMQQLQQEHLPFDYCVVGEASSEEQFGDYIKVGRRGTLSADLVIIGKQGHVAYPHKALNPIHQVSQFLAEFCQQQWDQAYQEFPATSMQISNIHAGTGANNVIPGELQLSFNFRYNPANSVQNLQQQVSALLEKYQLNYKITWQHGGEPFYCKAENLKNIVSAAVTEISGITPKQSTHGGTSDGRFVAPTGTQVVEFGPINRSIHQIDECITLDEIIKLHEVYYLILEKLFA